jgi:hypothetical protein
MRKRAQREPTYPQGDSPPGVVFYLIDSRRLPWSECKGIVREIAVEFAQNGPFRVRFGARKDGDSYWLAFNHEECGVAFELVVDIKAYKITKSSQLPGGNPAELKVVLGSDEFRSYQHVSTPEPMGDDWDAPAAQPQEAQYADHYTGVVFYLLDSGEIEPAIAIEAINDVAAFMLQPMGRAKPFAVRRGIRKESATHYWVGLNNTVAGVLFERTLGELQVRVTKRSKLPDGTSPVLRLVLNLPGVPVLPLPSVPRASSPEPLPDWTPEPLVEPEPVRRDRMAWAKSVDVSGMAARWKGKMRMPGRRRRGDSSEPPPE